jgi:hypothetical protein
MDDDRRKNGRMKGLGRERNAHRLRISTDPYGLIACCEGRAEEAKRQCDILAKIMDTKQAAHRGCRC